VFIIRKPHPNGLKVWSVVDHSGYFVEFSLFRRDPISLKNAPKEKSEATLLRMAKAMPKGTTIVGDSYFGSIPALELLLKEGYHVLLSSTQTRPSALFKDHLSTKLKKNGDHEEAYGIVKGENEKNIPFLASVFRSNDKNICTLSSVFSAEMEEVEVETQLRDGSEDQQQYMMSQQSQIRPEVRVAYADLMNFVDQADARINTCYSKVRKMAWSQAYVTYGSSLCSCRSTPKNYTNPQLENLIGLNHYGMKPLSTCY